MDAERREIAYFTGSFLPPSEIFMVEQARHLTKYKPRFIAAQRHASRVARQYPMQVDCLSDSVRGRVAAAKLKLCGWVDPMFRRMIKNAGLLHAQFGKNGYLAWPVAKGLDLPFVTTFHGFDATFVGNPLTVEGFNQRLFFWRGRREMAKAGLNCIAVSNYIRGRLLELGFPEHRIFRRYIGIDTTLFTPQPGIERVKNRVVCVSRFIEYKGHRFIVDALARLSRSGIPVELIMIGQGALRDDVERSARGKIKKVTVLDDLNQKEILSLLCTAQLYLHGSYKTSTGHAEALGLSILEAQAAGTPVVAFDSGGTGEALAHNKSGYLVAEKDVNAMSDKAAALLTDTNRWQSFSQAGVDFVRTNFDITGCSKLLEETYDNVVREHASERSAQ